MLHEILLSLSGHPSPLLREESPSPSSLSTITPPERQLLASAAHLSNVHIKVIAHAAEIASSHPSAICRAVATAIESTHLAAFQRKVLEVESSILKEDPGFVGAYNIVPLTAVMAEFEPWTRGMDWLWATVQFMAPQDKRGSACPGAKLMNHLRNELQSGYKDIQDIAMSLLKSAEAAWLKQVSAWVLYGKLPSFGAQDFFIQRSPGTEVNGEDYTCDSRLLPSIVTPSTASSMLFIGRSLNHVRVKSSADLGLRGMDDLPAKLQQLSSLELPLNAASFSRAIVAVRRSLAESTLQRLLPLSKVVEMLYLLRSFFLLGRGEFAMALTQEADERARNRWRTADNLAYEKRDTMDNVTVKDGEVAAVLSRTWAALASAQGQHDDEDEQLELARDLLRLELIKSKSNISLTPVSGSAQEAANLLTKSPFNSLLFSVPSGLMTHLPSPLNMVISNADLHIYSCLNAYLLSMRRAHIRLTDLWKITSLRRHHPAPRGADESTAALRERWDGRLSSMRSSWTTASAAIFFLGETEAYLQTEIVAVLWEGFHAWMLAKGGTRDGRLPTRPESEPPRPAPDTGEDSENEDEEDLWLRNAASSRALPKSPPHRTTTTTKLPHDPQTLSTAHSLYLRTLCHRLLLTQESFTTPLHKLLVHIDYLVAHVRRLHSIYTSLDLETDAGVVDAFTDLDREESEVKAMLQAVERKVQAGIIEVVASLRGLEADVEFMAEWEGERLAAEEQDGLASEDNAYRPARVGGINRLLMKLDFGNWL